MIKLRKVICYFCNQCSGLTVKSRKPLTINGTWGTINIILLCIFETCTITDNMIYIKYIHAYILYTCTHIVNAERYGNMGDSLSDLF